MSRILDIADDKRTPEQICYLRSARCAARQTVGPYRVWIHSPRIAAGMEEIGTYLNMQGSLSTREVEIGILVIAEHWDADYVRQAHIRLGREAGLPEQAIQDIVAGRDPKLSDPHEDAVYKFSAALAAGAKMPDAEFAKIEKVLGRDGVAEVLVLLGYYTSVALAMKVHELPVVKA